MNLGVTLSECGSSIKMTPRFWTELISSIKVIPRLQNIVVKLLFHKGTDFLVTNCLVEILYSGIITHSAWQVMALCVS
jgi:hypothetical protein